MGNVIFGIIVLIFIISAVKRMLESLAREAQKNAPRGGDFEAGPSEVEEFLRGLQQARGQQPQVQARPGRLQAPVRRGMAAGAPLLEDALLTGEGRGPAAPAVRPVRVRRHRRAEDDVVETLVAREPAKEGPSPEARPAAVAPAVLEKMSLRDAVIWAEILGAPVSKRRRADGGRPCGPMGR